MLEQLLAYSEAKFGPTWGPAVYELVTSIAFIVAILVPLMLSVAYLTLWERKLIGWMQIRIGPNRVGPAGLLQPIADGVKLLFKEVILPTNASKALYIIGPIMMLMPAIAAWAVIPFDQTLVLANINVGILYIFAIGSLGVYGIIMAGWASNSKYAFLGALRSAAQMVSYEVSIGFVLVTVLLRAGSLNLSKVVLAQSGWFWHWYWLTMLPMFVIFFISALAETNRPPFDLVEAESELVAGFMVEYGSTPYMMFMLGEYVAIGTMCAMATILFLGGWLPPVKMAPFTWVPGVIWFTLKALFMFFLFAMAKAIVPRYRYDQLMRLGWKVFLPLSLAMVVIVAAVLQFGGAVLK